MCVLGARMVTVCELAVVGTMRELVVTMRELVVTKCELVNEGCELVEANWELSCVTMWWQFGNWLHSSS